MTDVTVRFSVQDAETVRAALEKLGTDGQRALERINAAGQSSSGGLKAVSAIVEDLKNRASGLAFSLGPAGTGLIALGPVGLAAGAALGLVAAAISHVIDEANRLGSVSQSMRNLSETTGIAGTLLQALTNQGGELGIESDKVTNSLSRFTAQLNDVHQAQGTLYTEILKVNPVIADQMVKTRDNVVEWNLLAKAYALADTNQRAAIANAAFGRGNIGTGRLLESTASAGGVGALAAQQLGVLSDEQIKKFAELKSKIDETNRTAKDLMASIWTEDVLQRELQAAQQFERIARAAKDIHDNEPGGAWSRFWADVGRALSGDAAVLNREDQPKPKITVNKTPDFAAWAGEGSGDAMRAPDKETAEAALNKMRTWMTILGPAATLTQQLSLRQAELNALVEKAGGQYKSLGDRAMEAYRVQQSGSDLQIKLANNAASADELMAQRKKELNLLVANQKLTQDEANQSLDTYATKTLPEIIRQEEVRKSQFEGLTKFKQDASNLNLNLDRLGTDVSGNVVSGFADMTTGAKTFQAGLKDMGSSVVRTIDEILLKMTVGRAVAMAFNSAFSAFFPSGTNASIGDIQALGGGGGPINSPFAHGGAFNNGNVVPFRRGGVFNKRTMFSFAKGIGELAEAGRAEAILPLEKLSGGDLGVRASGAGGATVEVNVDVHNSTDSAVSVQKQRNSSGGVDLKVMVHQAVNEGIQTGAFDKSNSARYGLRVGAARR